ncbi:MAG: acetyl-CoA acetyltransferase [candidate division WOR-3 bacterium]
MKPKVAIIGIGATPFRSITPDVSYKELMYEAAVKAYHDAGIDPRKDVDTFVTCAEDYIEGTSIFDEYVPDQLGAALRPMHTIAGDGLHGIAAAWLQIITGRFDIAVIEAHAKSSNILSPEGIEMCAQDPVYTRPLRLNSLFIAGLEMNLFSHQYHLTSSHLAAVVIKNRNYAIDNPIAGRAAVVTEQDYMNSPYLATPLREMDVARPVDGAVVIVLASEKKARELCKKPVWIKSVGWCNGSYSIESRSWEVPDYVTKAATMAYAGAGISCPTKEIDFAEVDDTFSYKEIQHLLALGLVPEKELPWAVTSGRFALDGDIPVNSSGGALGMGYLYEATGLARLYWAVQQLRGEAGKNQLASCRVGLVQAWRGLPTSSSVVIILES